MCDRSVIISNGKKLYIATFELISDSLGEKKDLMPSIRLIGTYNAQ
jgi:hypothetical protein